MASMTTVVLPGHSGGAVPESHRSSLLSPRRQLRRRDTNVWRVSLGTGQTLSTNPVAGLTTGTA